MEIVDLFLNNEAVCRALTETGGDQVYNCAIQNKTAGFTTKSSTACEIKASEENQTLSQ
jgi:hypothetical protein